jgi:3-oxoacyl-[acyl-carrier protein] reductase
MDLGLGGKIALVTGGSRGIGRGIALELAREGCDVAVCARGEAELEATAREIEAMGRRALAVSLDLAGASAPAELVERVEDELGPVDVAVGNVGSNRRGAFETLSDDDWREMLDLNFRSHERLARAVIPAMKERGSGSLVFTASIYGREAGGPGLSIYNTTKSALISLVKVLALELAPHGVRANTVAPGSIRFPGGSWDRRVREDPEGMAEWVGENLPLGRFGRVEEVAAVVAFLASERASLVTGACVPVDGAQGRSLI